MERERITLSEIEDIREEQIDDVSFQMDLHDLHSFIEDWAGNFEMKEKKSSKERRIFNLLSRLEGELKSYEGTIEK